MMVGYAVTMSKLQLWLQKRTDYPSEMREHDDQMHLCRLTNAYMFNREIACRVVALPPGYCVKIREDARFLLLCWAYRMPMVTDKRPKECYNAKEPQLLKAARFWMADMPLEWRREIVKSMYVVRVPRDDLNVFKAMGLMNKADAQEANKVLTRLTFC